MCESQDVRKAGSLCSTSNKANRLPCSCFGAAEKDPGLFLAAVGLGGGEGTGAVFVTLRFYIMQSPSWRDMFQVVFNINQRMLFFPQVEICRLTGQQTYSTRYTELA